MASLEDKLNQCLATQEDGLVHFNPIRKLLKESSSGVCRLLSKGNWKDIKANLINLLGDEVRVLWQEGPKTLMDPRLAVSYIKMRRPGLIEAVTHWEATYGRGDIPEALSKDAPDILHHITVVFANDFFRCYYEAGIWYFCLHDMVRLATEDSDVDEALDKAYELDATLYEACEEGRTRTFNERYNLGLRNLL